MHGANVQQLACPRCRTWWTLRYRPASLFCFNCHLFWNGLPAPETDLWPEPPPYPFTPAELARLRFYRAAIQAGFYTDS